MGDQVRAGDAWELFILMKDEEPTRVIAKDPKRPRVIDVTADLRRLLTEKDE